MRVDVDEVRRRYQLRLAEKAATAAEERHAQECALSDVQDALRVEAAGAVSERGVAAELVRALEIQTQLRESSRATFEATLVENAAAARAQRRAWDEQISEARARHAEAVAERVRSCADLRSEAASVVAAIKERSAVDTAASDERTRRLHASAVRQIEFDANDKLEARLCILTEAHDAATRERARTWEAELERARSRAEEQLGAMGAQHTLAAGESVEQLEVKLATLGVAHEAAMRAREATWAGELARTRSEHDAERAALDSRHAGAAEHSKALHEAQLAELAVTHRAASAKRSTAWRAELDGVRESHSDQQLRFVAELAQARSALEAEREELEAEHAAHATRDAERHRALVDSLVDAHGVASEERAEEWHGESERVRAEHASERESIEARHSAEAQRSAARHAQRLAHLEATHSEAAEAHAASWDAERQQTREDHAAQQAGLQAVHAAALQQSAESLSSERAALAGAIEKLACAGSELSAAGQESASQREAQSRAHCGRIASLEDEIRAGREREAHVAAQAASEHTATLARLQRDHLERCEREVAEATQRQAQLLRRRFSEKSAVETSVLRKEHASAMVEVASNIEAERAAGALAVTTQHRAQESHWRAEVQSAEEAAAITARNASRSAVRHDEHVARLRSELDVTLRTELSQVTANHRAALRMRTEAQLALEREAMDHRDAHDVTVVELHDELSRSAEATSRMAASLALLTEETERSELTTCALREELEENKSSAADELSQAEVTLQLQLSDASADHARALEAAAAQVAALEATSNERQRTALSLRNDLQRSEADAADALTRGQSQQRKQLAALRAEHARALLAANDQIAAIESTSSQLERAAEALCSDLKRSEATSVSDLKRSEAKSVDELARTKLTAQQRLTEVRGEHAHTLDAAVARAAAAKEIFTSAEEVAEQRHRATVENIELRAEMKLTNVEVRARGELEQMRSQADIDRGVRNAAEAAHAQRCVDLEHERVAAEAALKAQLEASAQSTAAALLSTHTTELSRHDEKHRAEQRASTDRHAKRVGELRDRWQAELAAATNEQAAERERLHKQHAALETQLLESEAAGRELLVQVRTEEADAHMKHIAELSSTRTAHTVLKEQHESVKEQHQSMLSAHSVEITRLREAHSSERKILSNEHVALSTGHAARLEQTRAELSEARGELGALSVRLKEAHAADKSATVARYEAALLMQKRQLRESHTAEEKSLVERHEIKLSNRIAEDESRAARLREAHAVEKKSLLDQHEATLSKHTAELQRLRDAHVSEEAGLVKAHGAKVTQLKAQHVEENAAAKLALQADHAKALRLLEGNLRAEFSKQRKSHDAEHAAEVDTAENKLRSAIVEHAAKVDALTKKLGTADAKVQELRESEASTKDDVAKITKALAKSKEALADAEKTFEEKELEEKQRYAEKKRALEETLTHAQEELGAEQKQALEFRASVTSASASVEAQHEEEMQRAKEVTKAMQSVATARELQHRETLGLALSELETKHAAECEELRSKLTARLREVAKLGREQKTLERATQKLRNGANDLQGSLGVALTGELHFESALQESMLAAEGLTGRLEREETQVAMLFQSSDRSAALLETVTKRMRAVEAKLHAAKESEAVADKAAAEQLDASRKALVERDAATAEHTEAIMSLKDAQAEALSEHAEQMEGMQSEHAVLLTRLDELYNAHDTSSRALSDEHAVAIEAHAAQLSTAEAEMEEAHAAEKESLVEHHEAIFVSKSDAHAQHVQSMHAKHAVVVEEHMTTISHHAEAKAALLQEHATAKSTLLFEHAAEKSTLRSVHEGELSTLHDENEELRTRRSEEVSQQMQALQDRLERRNGALRSTEDALAATEAAAADELNALRATHASELSSRAEQLQRARTADGNAWEKRIEALQMGAEEERSNMRDALAEKLAAERKRLAEQHDATVTSLREEHVAAKHALEAELSALQSHTEDAEKAANAESATVARLERQYGESVEIHESALSTLKAMHSNELISSELRVAEAHRKLHSENQALRDAHSEELALANESTMATHRDELDALHEASEIAFAEHEQASAAVHAEAMEATKEAMKDAAMARQHELGEELQRQREEIEQHRADAAVKRAATHNACIALIEGQRSSNLLVRVFRRWRLGVTAFKRSTSNLTLRVSMRRTRELFETWRKETLRRRSAARHEHRIIARVTQRWLTLRLTQGWAGWIAKAARAQRRRVAWCRAGAVCALRDARSRREMFRAWRCIVAPARAHNACLHILTQRARFAATRMRFACWREAVVLRAARASRSEKVGVIVAQQRKTRALSRTLGAWCTLATRLRERRKLALRMARQRERRQVAAAHSMWRLRAERTRGARTEARLEEALAASRAAHAREAEEIRRSSAELLEATESAYSRALVDELERYAMAEKGSSNARASASAKKKQELQLQLQLRGSSDTQGALEVSLDATRHAYSASVVTSASDELRALRAHFADELRKRDVLLAGAKVEMRELARRSRHELDALAGRHRESLRVLRSLVH